MPLGKTLRQILGAGLPAGIALAALAAAGALPVPAAAAAWGATLAVSALFVVPRARGLRELEGWTARLADGESPPAPDLPAHPLGVLARNLGRVARLLDSRRDERLQGESVQELLVEAVPIPVLVVGRDERILDANSAAAELFGTEPAGRAVLEVVRAPEVAEALARSRERAGPAEAGFALPEPDGRVLKVAVRPLGRADGGEPGTLLLFEDRTAADRRDQVRGSFIANASHEIRTPLTAIAGLVETLAGPARDDPEARDRYLDRLADQSGRLQALVEDLLSLSRVEMEEDVPPEGGLDLAALARSVVHDTDWQERDRGIRVLADTPDGPVAVPGDATQLRQMLVNLVDNAVKHGRGGGTVSVEVSRGGGDPPEAVVAVADDGPGIAAEEVERIAERFYRGEDARRTRVPGHGLGLAIVKHVALRHRGRLDIDSEPGRGSRFAVRLPAAAEPGPV